MSAGRVYLAPEDRHLGVDPGGRVLLSSEPPIGQFRPAADHLFASLARSLLPALGVILTGMGQDGTSGLRELRAAGGTIVAQDEATSVVFGMPGAAIGAGLVDEVLPDDQIGPAITRIVERSWQN